jgi:hypothetical protein
MKTRHSLSLGGIVLLFVIGLTACNLPNSTELPLCTPEQLQAPTNLSPHGESAVVDSAPNLYLYWEYPPTLCQPDFFELYLWSGLEPDIPGMKVRIPYSQTFSDNRWRAPWSVPLVPGNTYHWQVYAGLETGPGDDVRGNSARGYFFTGPVCSADTDYQPVTLLSPADEIVITSPTEPILFVWDDPTPCLVDYVFEFQIWSPSPEFDWDSPYLRRSQSLQSTFPRTPEQLDLQDCQRYYWRIKTDPAGPPEDPFSEIRSFVTNFHGGLCPAVVETPGWILAFPKDLLCREGPGLDYGIYAPLRQGEQVAVTGRNKENSWWYIETQSQRRCWVPGEVLELIEGWQRVPVLEFDLPDYKPRCPTESLLAPILNAPADGALVKDTWPSLTWNYPDRLCDPEGYRIDLSLDPTFADTSLSGGTGNPSTAWGAAHPLDDCQIYHWRVAAINDITLGPFSQSWWFRIDAENACTPLFRFSRNAFCRAGPGQAYRQLAGFASGDFVEMLGRNSENSWWYIFWRKSDVRCWVSDATGVAIGDVGRLPVLEVAPPTVVTAPTEVPQIETPQPRPTLACSRHTDSASCNSDSTCRWVLPVTGGQGYCTEK